MMSQHSRRDDESEILGARSLPDNSHPILATLGEAALDLQIVFRVLDRNPHVSERIRDIAQSIMNAAAADPDVAQLSLHRVRKGGYSVWHSVHTATVLAVAGPRMGVKPNRLAPLVAAALTMNVGMGDLQDGLFEQREAISASQKAAVFSHPVRSAQLLRICGVDDPFWLRLVEQHHEKTDGSGYPNGLKKADIVPEARLLQVAELYCALTTPRRYRYPIETPEQFAETLIQRSEQLGPHFARLLLKILGNVPPGSCVVLANGEIGEAVGMTAGGNSHQHVRVADGRGTGFLRNTSVSSYRIVRILDELPSGMRAHSHRRHTERAMHLVL